MSDRIKSNVFVGDNTDFFETLESQEIKYNIEHLWELKDFMLDAPFEGLHFNASSASISMGEGASYTVQEYTMLVSSRFQFEDELYIKGFDGEILNVDLFIEGMSKQFRDELERRGESVIV